MSVGDSRGPSALAALAVNLAVTPGAYAFFLGSGISRAAGVPSGWEVLHDLAGRWQRAEDLAANEDPLLWAERQLGEPPTYSGLLERLCPTPEQRRSLIASYFSGRRPTEAHRALARLASDGLVRVFVTTNFDRLLEAALDDAGIRWSRVASEAELETAQPRGVAPVSILKLHGDYGSVDIRNTASELSVLSDGLAQEFTDILRRNGLVVIGYAGEDDAVRDLMVATSPRYGLYWTTRGQPTDRQLATLNAADGHAISISDADGFVADLERRLRLLRQSPGGRTPSDHYAAIVDIIRRSDMIGLREALKDHADRLVQGFRSWLDSSTARAPQWSFEGTPEDQQAATELFADSFGPLIDEALAFGLACAEYRVEDLPVWLRGLDRLRSEVHAGVAEVNGACGDIAAAAALQVLAGATRLRGYAALEELLKWPDVSMDVPWLVTPAFHHYRFAGTDATWTPRINGALLQRSDVWRIATRDERPMQAVLFAELLIEIEAEALSSRTYPWSYTQGHSELGEEIRRLGRDPQLLAALAAALGESGDAYLAAFPGRYFARRESFKDRAIILAHQLGREELHRLLGIPRAGESTI